MTNLTLPIRLDPASPPNETLHVTASGLPVRIYAIDGGGKYPIHGATYINGQWNQFSWQADGAYGHLGAHDFDLRDRAPVKRGVWVAWFEYVKGGDSFFRKYATQSEAQTARHPWCTLRGTAYLAEGDGLDTPADPPLWVDWAQLPEWAEWAAADEDGKVVFYQQKPFEDQDEFLGMGRWDIEEGDYQIASLDAYRLAPGFKWRETLTQRPEGV